MRILGVIPARYGSTRFPGKPLALIHGKPMIQCVYEQAKQATMLTEVVIATDDQRIANAAASFGGRCIMTSSTHPTGTDRCYEALRQLNESSFDAVINIQGDEPFIDPKQIDELASCLMQPGTEIGTLIKQANTEELFDPNKPKVVVDRQFYALYFSRQAIPYLRGIEKTMWVEQHNFYKHIGIYGYRSDVLKAISALEIGKLEGAESLEQLRWLESGYRIRTSVTEIEAFSVDTPEDLAKIQEVKRG
jgi:3-deoxy-manno-octulosonate cytidylyltransferase (CMP-KDO synthetase)